ncbi:MAG: hypothetical protein QF463_02920 [Vicinamibacterales bacterium]|jgi:hypothetical protein|nr:hypothetical protein [Vicinamibacterales bacterium]MDP6607996.1 hypothetical protein [Vicinamibacterales bacterium]|tara:strand:- start:5596 stop:5724 length:129 start_codon:yes stop_codon:yes gene_type:complete
MTFPPDGFPEPGPSMTPTYVAVLVVEAVVLLALWGFSQYFGA